MAHDVSTLTAQKRDQAGKGPAHRLRAKGLIPAVCYGPYEKPLHVAVDPLAIQTAIATPHKFNTVIKLQIEGGETRTVLFKDFERDPVEGNILHADFLEVRMDKDVVVNVPVILTGKPEGVTAGGILQQVARTLPVQCKPSDIPEKIEVDVSALKIAESLHLKDVKMPAGVQLKIRGDQTIAVVNVPEKEEEAPKPAAAAAVPGAEGVAAPAAPGAPGAPAPAAGAPAAPGAAAPAAGAAKAPAADKGAKK
ncbi:MAG: 50S ribosomal protein L25 [Myxococcales bacterium]